MRVARYIALFVALAAFACKGTSPTAPTSVAPPSVTATRIVSVAANLAFGAVEVGRSAELTITIGNTGTSTLTITGIAVPGGYSAGWTGGLIAPGSSQQVAVRFAPTTVQAYDGTLTINGDQTAGANTVALTGSGRTATPTMATITGTATEVGGAPLAGANIEVRDGPDAKKYVVTDTSGAFTMSGLQPGAVILRAWKTGYVDTDQPVSLTAGGLLTLSFVVPKTGGSVPTTPGPTTPGPTTPGPTTPIPPTSPSVTSYDEQILALVNNHRRSIGKPDLVMVKVIWDQAYGHSLNMATGAVAFGHTGFDARIATIRASLGSSGYGSENVAMGYTSAASVVSGWLGSSGHRANIESNATRTGISAVKSASGTWYYTQIFY
jgi:uncharacterized protein YkwD